MTDHTELLERLDKDDIYACQAAAAAIRELTEKLEAERKARIEYEQENARNILRLVATIKYLVGIAERGTGTEIGPNETAEQFVLGYAKSIEGRLATIEGEMKERCAEIMQDWHYPAGPDCDNNKRAEAIRALKSTAAQELPPVVQQGKPALGQPASAVATDEQGRPITYWGGMKNPAVGPDEALRLEGMERAELIARQSWNGVPGAEAIRAEIARRKA